MASNILSRFLPPATGEPSIYETLRQQDDHSDDSDVEERPDMAIDEENLGTRFHDYELGDALSNTVASQIDQSRIEGNNTQNRRHSGRVRGSQAGAALSKPNMDEAEDEVPQSLLIEDELDTLSPSRARQAQAIPPPVPGPGPANRGTRARWQATQEQQRLYQDPPPTQKQHRLQRTHGYPVGTLTPKERALWMWANVENLDNFLQDVYDYFVGNGIWSIFLSRLLNLL